MAGKKISRPPSEHGSAGKTAAPAGKETQPDNSKCVGVDNKCTGVGGIEMGSSRNDGGYEQS